MQYHHLEITPEASICDRVTTCNIEKGLEALSLRAEFLAYLNQSADGIEAFDARAQRWQKFVEQFGAHGVCLPSEYCFAFEAGLNARITHAALSGYAMGFGCDSMIGVAHAIFDHHPQHLAAFLALAAASGHGAAIRAQDHDGRWHRKVARLVPLGMALPARYRPNLKFAPLMKFLFPSSSAVFEELELSGRVPH